MNEILFLIQILLVISFSYGAFYIGKEALFTAISLQAIFANFFILQQIDFFGFSVTCSDAFAIGSMFCLNLLREYYGKRESKKAIFVCFFFMIFFIVMSQVHLYFHPNAYDTSHSSYLYLLSPAPRLLFASIFVFFLSQYFDMRSFGFISKYFPNLSFTIRSCISLSLIQLFDTIIFSFLGLYGIVANLFHVILISFILKLLIILTISYIISLYKKVQKT